jgi:hypothetical protein
LCGYFPWGFVLNSSDMHFRRSSENAEESLEVQVTPCCTCRAERYENRVEVYNGAENHPIVNTAPHPPRARRGCVRRARALRRLAGELLETASGAALVLLFAWLYFHAKLPSALDGGKGAEASGKRGEGSGVSLLSYEEPTNPYLPALAEPEWWGRCWCPDCTWWC